MDNEEIREQPEMEQTKDGINVCVDSDSGSQKSSSGLGKFQSPQALLEAYNALQAEFTRKCQRLSELEKDKTIETKPNINIDQGLSEFLSQNTDAQNYSEELREKVSSTNESNPFETAFAQIILDKMRANSSQKACDPIIKKYVFDDEEFRNKVIESYMEDLNAKKPPVVLNSEGGQRATKQDPVAPKTLFEAKKIMEEMFS